MKRLMKRLIKKALIDINIFKSTLSQLSTKGRGVLKNIEDYKFTIEQTTRLLANDQHLAQKIIQKKKILDQAAGLIYSVVFDIENIDITQEYNDQIQEVENGPENLPQNNPDISEEIPEETEPKETSEENKEKNEEEIPPEGTEKLEEETEPTEEETEKKPKDMRNKPEKQKPEKETKEKSKKEEPKKEEKPVKKPKKLTPEKEEGE